MQARGYLVVAALAMSAATGVAAGGFAAMASPPRFELDGKAGERINAVVEISNADTMPAKYRIYTNDWSFAPDNSVQFKDELAPGSCRPWVSLQRKEMDVAPGGHVRFRFQLDPPAGAPAGECRFALMVEGAEPLIAPGAPMPIAARLAVIVYLRLGDARPQLQVLGGQTVGTGAARTAQVKVRNGGSAHGRLSGFLTGVDGSGRKLDFAVSTLPILPGETRALALTGSLHGKNVADVSFPVTVKGTLEWENHSEPFEHVFD